MRKIDGKRFFSPARAKTWLQRKISRQGQTLVEYALILAIISIVAISVLINMGQNLRAVYSMIDSQVSRANSG